MTKNIKLMILSGLLLAPAYTHSAINVDMPKIKSALYWEKDIASKAKVSFGFDGIKLRPVFKPETQQILDIVKVTAILIVLVYKFYKPVQPSAPNQ